jgi:hypothetical protein
MVALSYPFFARTARVAAMILLTFSSLSFGTMVEPMRQLFIFCLMKDNAAAEFFHQHLE